MDALCDSHRDANSDAYVGLPDPNSDSDQNLYAHAHQYSRANRHSNRYLHPWRADVDADDAADCHSGPAGKEEDSYSGAEPDSYPYRNTYENRDSYSDSYANRHYYADAEADGYRGSAGQADSNVYPDSYAHTYPDQYPDDYADSYTDEYTN